MLLSTLLTSDAYKTITVNQSKLIDLTFTIFTISTLRGVFIVLTNQLHCIKQPITLITSDHQLLTIRMISNFHIGQQTDLSDNYHNHYKGHISVISNCFSNVLRIHSCSRSQLSQHQSSYSLSLQLLVFLFSLSELIISYIRSVSSLRTEQQSTITYVLLLDLLPLRTE